MQPVTFQINLAPGDYRHSKYLLKYHLELFSDLVDEILLTYDVNPRKIISSTEVNEFDKQMLALVEELSEANKKIKFQRVDYSSDVVEKVTLSFFNRMIPQHDYRGAPIYPYLFGIYYAKNDYVFHIDSDMFFGGLSRTWLKEAQELMIQNPAILTTSPLPGPPHPEGILVKQREYKPYPNKAYAFIFDQMSTRVFLIDRRKINKKLRPVKPVVKERIFAYAGGFSSIDTLEVMITNCMKEHSYKRLDFLGNSPGLWSLHPNYRSQSFYRQIPDIIDRLKRMDIPEEQYGYYNISDNFIDWEDGIRNFKNNRLRNKIFKKFGIPS
jgi:hypothetical protein